MSDSDPKHPDFPGVDGFREQTISNEPVGEVLLETLGAGESLSIVTKKHTYTLEKREDGFYISGNPKYCPTPTKVISLGSGLTDGLAEKNVVREGMPLQFTIPAEPNAADNKPKTVRTTLILEVKKLPKKDG